MGPIKFRTPEPPDHYREVFYAPGNPEPGWLLEVWNGNPDGSQRISAATILVNGVSVLPSSFSQESEYVRVDVTTLIHPVNDMDVEVRGTSGGFIAVQVTSTCTDLVLMAQKCGAGNADVCLSWTGGCCVGVGCAVEYDLYSSISPKMSAFPAHLLGDPLPSPLTSHTDVGTAGDPRPLVCYIAADQTKPTIQITSPAPGFTTSSPTIAVSGTHDGASWVYVNEAQATLGASTFDIFDPPGLALVPGMNTLFAAAKQSLLPFANIALAFGPSGTLGGNPPPTIEFPSPADGSTIYDDTPLLKVWFCDPDGRGTIDKNSKFVQLDGTDVTTLFSSETNVPACGSGAEGLEFSYQVTTPLADGMHFLAATVPDTAGYTTNGSASFLLRPPLITSLTPVEGTVGVTVTIDGAGFDPSGTNDVRFGSVLATIEAVPPMSETQITTTVPVGAVGGPVTVEVNGRKSNEFPFRVLLASGFTTITSVAINDTMADASRTPILFAAAGTSDEVWQLMGDGTYEGKLVTTNDPVGLPLDSTGRTYFGSSVTGANNGRVDEIVPPAPGSNSNLMLNTRVIGESNSRIDGCGAPQPPGVGARIYLLDGANGKVKRMDEDAGGGHTIAVVRSGFTFAQSNSCLKSADGSRLYFTDISSLKSMPIAGGIPRTHDNIGGPRGMANALTAEGWPVVARSGPAAGQGYRVAVVDILTTPTCTVGTCPTYDLFTPGISLIDVDYGADVDGPYVVVAEQSEVYRVDEPSIALSAWNGTTTYPIPERVDADFDPISGTTLSGVQFLVLQATLNPSSLIPDDAPDPFPAEVEWIVEDMDDPSDDFQIDPNGTTGNDNVVPLGFNPYAPLWEEWPPYTMEGGTPSNNTTVTTSIQNGVSRVQLNLAGRPGENYRVTAKVKAPIFGDIMTESVVFTVWKTLYLELDSMGPCQGPFNAEPDGDDVPCQDVTQPDTGSPALSYFANAFRPAYVDVKDAAQASPSVRFKYHVEESDTIIQGTLGREAPVSSRGYWEAVLQSGYDGPVLRDNDPIGESARTGASAIIQGVNAVSLAYTETLRDDAVEQTKDLVYAQRYVELHEVAHQFRLDDQSGALMEFFGDPYFSSCQIKIIRRCLEYPSQLDFIPAADTCTITCP